MASTILSTQGVAELPREHPEPLRPPPETEAIRERLESLRAAGAMRSADGQTWIVGPALASSDKLVLIRFLEDLRRRTARALGFSMDGPAYAVALHAVHGEAGEPCRIQVRVTQESTPPIRIVLINPESLHPPDLARRFCSALLRADALAHGYTDPVGPGPGDREASPYPGWLGAGLARWLELSRRQSDAERVLHRWERAQLPGVRILADAFSPYAMSDPALAAQLVAWLLDAPERGARVSALRSALSDGTRWTPALLAAVMGLEDDPLALEHRWNSWWLSRRWTVLTIGTTEAGLVRRTRSQLRVWPGNPGTPLDVFQRRSPPLEPRDLIALRDAPWIEATASRQILGVQRLASGRDEAYRGMAEAYLAFFVGLHRKESVPRLTQRLEHAEALLLQLERTVEPYSW